jgi:hypothetical protein
MSAALWKCDECERIGEEPAAERHMEQTGHAIERLTDAEAEGVRAIWAREGRRPDGTWATFDPLALRGLPRV